MPKAGADEQSSGRRSGSGPRGGGLGLRGWWTIALGVAISAGCLFLAGSHVEWDETLAQLRLAVWWPWLPLAVLAYLLGQLVRGVRCRALVWDQARLGTFTATNIVVVGYAVNNLLPLRLGELARAGMLAERTGLPYAQALAVTFIERLFDALTILALLSLGLLALPGVAAGPSTVLVALALVGAAVLLVGFIAGAPGLVTALVTRLTHRLPQRAQERAIALVAHASAGFRCVRRPAVFFPVAALSVLVWVLEIGLFFFPMLCFGLEPSAALATLTMSATNLGILVPSAPGFVGSFDAIAMHTLHLYGGVPMATALGVAVTAHAGFYVPVTLWGVAVIAGYGIKLGTLRAVATAAPALSPEDALPGRVVTRLAPNLPDPPPSPLLASLCEALLPAERVELPGAQAAVSERVSRFVAAQLGALSTRYRLLLRVGLLGFWGLVLVTHARPFGRLSPERRRAIVRRWAWGPVTPARQLFKALRSTAVLAYYEDRAVQQALGEGAPQAPRALAWAPEEARDA